jgi:voltage-gated potassium channel
MKRIKKIIEDTDTKAGKWFDIFIQILIVISLISFSMETLPNLKPETQNVLWIINVVTIIIFTIEYVFRIIVSDKKLKFIFSFYGLIDLFAILPFYISFGIDLRSIRIFRMLRLFRMFKLVRYSSAIKRFAIAMKLIKQELVLFFAVTIMLLYMGGVGIYYFENSAQPEAFSSIFHSLWWSLITLTTVGYGDIYPITVGGKIFTFFILMIGLGIVAVPTGLFASAIAKARKIQDGGDGNIYTND